MPNRFVVCLIVYLGLVLCFLCPIVLSQVDENPMNLIELQYRSEDPIIETNPSGLAVLGDQNASKSIKIPGLENRIIPGEPVVPFRTAKILIPPGSEILEIEVIPGEKKNLGTIFIEPGQDALPISCMVGNISELEFTPLNETTYESMGPYPKEFYSVQGVLEKNGYKTLYVNLYPIQYIPKTKETYYFGTFDVRITTAPSVTLDQGLFRGLSKDQETITSMVDNPESIAAYTAAYSSDVVPTGGSLLLDENYDYVIITTRAFKDAAGPYSFKALADWKRSRGIASTVVAVEDIYVNYDGIDRQEKIRNFIRDVYQNNGITYVLLGGDADGSVLSDETENDLVPARGLWAWNYELNPPNIPSDLYYACLDGNYDYNGNGIYGEPNDGPNGDDVDLLAEVYVGRAPVDSFEEMNNFVRKTIDYESGHDPYLKEVLMVGEFLGFGGVSNWGGNSKDETKDGSKVNGYQTTGFPDEFNKRTLYSRDKEWSQSELAEIINQNVHTINHLGHAGVGTAMKMSQSDVDALSNDKYFFGYSQGCYAGAFDNRDRDGAYLPYDSILEQFVTTSGGAFAFIGNSRFGFGRRSSTDSPSQRYDRQFWDAIFGEDIKNLGQANQDSKEDNVGSIDRSSDGNVMRFSYYAINLLGDPETPYRMPLYSEHDLDVSKIRLPGYAKPEKAIKIYATIDNKGINDERDVIVQFMEDGVVKGSSRIPHLSTGSSQEVSFTWSKDVKREYNLGVYAVPLIGEDYTENNYDEKTINIRESANLILLVDDDDGLGYETYYENALEANDYNYIKTEESPSLAELNSFDCVVWFTGRDFTTTLSGQDQANLAAYLDGGGSLFITGQDIGYNVGDADFYSEYLYSEYMKDSMTTHMLEGLKNDPISDGIAIQISKGDGANNQYWPSEIRPVNSYATRIFNYQGSGIGAIRIDNGIYKVVYFAFGFEAINSCLDRNEVMGRVIKELISAPDAKLSVTKDASASEALPGEVLEYNITAANNGEVELADVIIKDSLLGQFFMGDLRPGESKSLKATHKVTVEDLMAGYVNSTTNATGSYVGKKVESCFIQQVVSVTNGPSQLSVFKEANVSNASVGDVIEYNITMTNNGNVTLNEIKLTDNLNAEASSQVIKFHQKILHLEPGQSQSLLVAYVVTEEDAGCVIVNTVQAEALDPLGNLVGPVTATVPVPIFEIVSSKPVAKEDDITMEGSGEIELSNFGTGKNVSEVTPLVKASPVDVSLVDVSPTEVESVEITPKNLTTEYLEQPEGAPNETESAPPEEIEPVESFSSTPVGLDQKTDKALIAESDSPKIEAILDVEDQFGCGLVSRTGIKDPGQYNQFCEHQLVSGVGHVDASTSIRDREIALEYHGVMSGDGEIEMDATQVYSQEASRLSRQTPDCNSPNGTSLNNLNFVDDTKLIYNGSQPLTGSKVISSSRLYGGINADVKETFSFNQLEKDQKTFFGSTQNSTINQTVGINTLSSFSGTWETNFNMTKMFYGSITSNQNFTGEFAIQKEIRFHESPQKGD